MLLRNPAVDAARLASAALARFTAGASLQGLRAAAPWPRSAPPRRARALRGIATVRAADGSSDRVGGYGLEEPWRRPPPSRARPPPPAVLDGLEEWCTGACPSYDAWAAWNEALGAARAKPRGAGRAEAFASAVNALLAFCGPSRAVVAPFGAGTLNEDAVTQVWVLPTRESEPTVDNVLVSFALDDDDAPTGAYGDSAAHAAAVRHVAARAAALQAAEVGDLPKVQEVAQAAHFEGYHNAEPWSVIAERQRSAKLKDNLPGFAARISADGAATRIYRADGAYPGAAAAAPRWTRPMPLAFASPLHAAWAERQAADATLARLAPPGGEERPRPTAPSLPCGFEALFSLLYAEPRELGQRTRMPALLARVLDNGFDKAHEKELVADTCVGARALRDGRWLLGHSPSMAVYLLPAAARRRLFPQETAPVALAVSPKHDFEYNEKDDDDMDILLFGCTAEALTKELKELVLRCGSTQLAGDISAAADYMPRLLRAKRAPPVSTETPESKYWSPPEPPQVHVLAIAPAGVPLTSLWAHPAWASRLADPEQRRELADVVAASLLAALRLAHAANVAHGFVCPAHIVLLPDTDVREGDVEGNDAAAAAARAAANASDVSELALALALLPTRRVRAMLVGWRRGLHGTGRWRRPSLDFDTGYEADALRPNSWYSPCQKEERPTPAEDCESVACVYAGLVHGAAAGMGAPPGAAAQLATPPWGFEAAGYDDWSKRSENTRTARRNAWLAAAPEVLGPRWTRFLEDARAGRARYSLDEADNTGGEVGAPSSA